MGASTGDRPRAVVRADASATIGLGHVTRSLALAEELAAAGWSVALCAAGVPPGVRPAAVELVETDPEPDPRPVLALDPDLVVVDGYHFTSTFFSALDRHAVPYVVVDDGGDTPAPRPAAVINQNPHADPAMYDHLQGDPRLLLGTDYWLIRREVVVAAAGPPPARSTSVLVAFGGSDPRGLSAPVAGALAGAGHDVRVAIGAGHEDREAAVAALDGAGVTVIRPADYVLELATAGVAVLAAGSSLWEAAVLGTPTVGVVVAGNQRRPAEAALEQGLIAGLVPADDRLPIALPPIVETVLARSPRLAPVARPSADGARRAARALGDLARTIALRPATIADERFLLALRSDPEVVRRSFGPVPSVAEHRAWLAAAIDDPARRLYVVEDGGRPIGQLRLDADRADGAETVSIAIAAPERGRGAGRRVLRAAQQHARDELVARIRPGNDASLAAFAAAGFACESSADGAVVMRWRRTHPSPERERR